MVARPTSGAFVHQQPVDVLGRHVAHQVLEQVQHLHARQRGLESGILEVLCASGHSGDPGLQSLTGGTCPATWRADGVARSAAIIAACFQATRSFYARHIFLFALLAALALSSCGLVDKMEINQGNYVTQDMVAKLKKGQTRQQVEAGARHPTTESVFHKDRWDYAYSLGGAARPSPRTSSPSCFADEKLKSWTVADLPTSPVVDRDPAYAILEKTKAGRQPGLVVAHRRLVAQVAGGHGQSRHRRRVGPDGPHAVRGGGADRDCTLVGALDAPGSPALGVSRRGCSVAMPTCW